MTPTNGQYMVLADLLGDALDRCAEVRFYGDSVFVAHKALRLVANMPSESEIQAIIYENARHTSITLDDVHLAARAILKRLGVER